jgi:hypothetical protein
VTRFFTADQHFGLAEALFDDKALVLSQESHIGAPAWAWLDILAHNDRASLVSGAQRPTARPHRRLAAQRSALVPVELAVRDWRPLDALVRRALGLHGRQ